MPPEPRIYMDHQATTPVDPAVLAAMLPWFTERFGNAASRTHDFGREAETAVETARARVAALIGAEASAIVFTSGATESVNLAMKGLIAFPGVRGRHVITALTEHRAVLDTCVELARQGCRITRLPVDARGGLDPANVEAAIADDTILVSLMLANNEIGTLHDVTAIGRIAKRRGVYFHCDAAQALGRLPIDVEAMGLDLLSLSGHKIYGPKGIGALYCRRRDPRVRLAAQLHGGGHERGLRSGTLNVPAIVGFGEACVIAGRDMTEESARLRGLAARLLAAIACELDGVTLHGDPVHRLPGNLNLGIAGVDAAELLARLPGIALSVGAACTSAAPRLSHVLAALGLSFEAARTCVRIGLGRFNTEAEVDVVATRIIEEARSLRRRDFAEPSTACEL